MRIIPPIRAILASAVESASQFSGMRISTGFFKNVLILMTGSIGAQIITATAAPLLSRIYAPAEFGNLGVYTSMVAIGSSVVTMQYHQAIMLPARDEEAARVLQLSLLSAMLMLLLGGAMVLAWGRKIFEFLGAAEITSWAFVVPISVFLSGANQSLATWNVRRKHLAGVSCSQVVKSSFSTVSQLLAGSCAIAGLGLIGGAFIGDASSLGFLAHYTQRHDGRLLTKVNQAPSLKQAAKKYSNFPKYSNPQSLANALSQNAPVLLLSKFFGPATAGMYAVGVRLLLLPMNVALSSFREVFFQKASQSFNEGSDIGPLFRKATAGLVAIAFLPVLVIFLFGEPIFSFVLGSQWAIAGSYARWLVLWMGVGFANSPAIIFGHILMKQRLMMMWDVSMLISRVLAITVGGVLGSALMAVILYSTVGILFNAAIIVLMSRQIAILTNRRGSHKVSSN